MPFIIIGYALMGTSAAVFVIKVLTDLGVIN